MPQPNDVLGWRSPSPPVLLSATFMPDGTARPRSSYLQYQQILGSPDRRQLLLWRLSADRLGFGGGLRPITLDKTLPVETQLGHLFAQRPARNVELFHHAGYLAAALGK